MLTRDTPYGGGANVDCSFDLGNVVFVGPPFEEVDQWKLNVVLFLDVLKQFGGGRGAGTVA